MKVKLEDDGEDNSELIEEIEDSFIEEYIPLPGQYEINEYRIMENLYATCQKAEIKTH